MLDGCAALFIAQGQTFFSLFSYFQSFFFVVLYVLIYTERFFSPQWRIWLCSYTTDDNNEKRREPLQGKNRSQVSSRRGHSELYTESALYWSMFFSFRNLNFSSKKLFNYYQKKTFTNSKHLVKIIVISDLQIRSSIYFTFLISTDTYTCKQRLEKEEKNLPTKVHTIADE
jgi:hypothetical protein